MPKLLANAVGNCIIANPNDWCATDLFVDHRLDGPVGFDSDEDWAQYYMLRAAQRSELGCIIWWFDEWGSPEYSLAEYLDLFDWLGQLRWHRDLRMVVGAHPDLPGRAALKARLQRMFGSESLPIHSTVADVVAHAARFAQPQLAFSKRISA
jgi:hypothetical protein